MNAEDRGLRDAVDDRAYDDAHRPTRSLRAEASLNEGVGNKKDGDADEHPHTGLPGLDVLRGLGKQIERNRRDHCSGSEPAEDSDELCGHCHPAHEEPCDEQRRLRENSPAKRFEYAAHPSAP